MPEDKLRSQYFKDVWIGIIIFLILIITIIIFHLNKEAMFKNEDQVVNDLLHYGFISFIAVFCVIIIIGGVKYFRDFKSIKQRKYERVTGIITRIDNRRRFMDAPEDFVGRPVTQIIDTEENIDLLIREKFEVGEIYEFMYLKNTKIAVIEKHVKREECESE